MQGMAQVSRPAIPSEGGVALMLPAPLQGCPFCSQGTLWDDGETRDSLAPCSGSPTR